MRRLGNTGVDVFEDDLLHSVTALNDTPRKNIRSIVVSAPELKQAYGGRFRSLCAAHGSALASLAHVCGVICPGRIGPSCDGESGSYR